MSAGTRLRTGFLHTPRRGPGAAYVLAATWLVLVCLHLTLRGRWWWFPVNMVPQAVFLAVPIALAVFGLWSAGTAGRSFAVAAVCLPSLLLGTVLSGTAPVHAGAAVAGTGQARAAPVRVVSWNTRYWDRGEDPDAFYARLRSLDADVYLLQEYVPPRGPAAEAARLAARFPGYRAVRKGDELTLSRVPVVAVPPVAADDVLRVDLSVGGRRVTVYNAHIPVPYTFGSGDFTGHLRAAERERAHQLAALERDMRANPAPRVVAGDFNASPVSGDLRPLRSTYTDVGARAGGLATGGTWGRLGLRMWRIDWAFASDNLAVGDYRTHDPRGLSDHRPITFRIGPADGRV